MTQKVLRDVKTATPKQQQLIHTGPSTYTRTKKKRRVLYNDSFNRYSAMLQYYIV